MSADPSIAIVGIGGIFPQAPTLEWFWANVHAGVDAAREVPEGRWLLPADEVYDSRVGIPDRLYSKRACFVEDFRLDPAGLDVDSALLAQLDPAFHLAMHAGRQALRDANASALDLRRVGVVIGNIVLPTEKASEWSRNVLGAVLDEQLAERTGKTTARPQWKTSALNCYAGGLPGGLLAQALRLGGGSYTLDAACASSLYALKLAADELCAGRADAMLTGGLSRPDCLYTQMGFAQLRALSPSGRCAPFEARADGLVVGEGAGMFVLKRLGDALRAGDHIYAVIRGIGLSNDVGGKLLAPTSEGQLRAMRAAYRAAGWQPADVDLIECHATGAPVGDAVEFESLRQLWSGFDGPRGRCVIGSVKSNIGHTLTAAGSAGLLKVLSALRHDSLPPTANFAAPHPKLAFADSPFRVLSKSEPWERRVGMPRRAALSAFGFGGINAHVLLEEWLAPEPDYVATVANIAEGEPPGEPLISASTTRQEPRSKAPAVAIVGMGACYGKWRDLRAFLERVLGGDDDDEDALEAPRHGWGVDNSRWFQERFGNARALAGYYLHELEVPLDRFRIPPKELEEMLPQQLLMLQVAAEAIADCRFRDDRLATGVFIGLELDLNTTNFHFRWSLRNRARQLKQELDWELSDADLEAWIERFCSTAGPPLTANRTMGALGGLVASRIAREFRIGGPSFTISSEETSGLSALGVAVRLLQAGEIEQALVGAVDLAGDIRAVFAAHSLGRNAVPGEGAAAIVLKRLDDALRDGDRIYATVKGLGATTGEAYAAELIGVEADVGACGAATGLAAVVKASICLYQEMLPPVRGNELLLPDQAGARASRRAQPWLRDRSDGPRRAAVRACGVDGNCRHVVLAALEGGERESDRIARLQPVGARGETLFVVSGDDAAQLRSGLQQLQHLAGDSATNVEAMARRWWRTQPLRHNARLAFALVAQDAGQLRELAVQAEQLLLQTSAQVRGPAAERIFFQREPLGDTVQVAFVFPGSGSHFAGMGRELAAQWPEILRRQDAENERLRSQFLPEIFWNASSVDDVADQRQLILGQVAFGTLGSDLLRALGIRPQAVLGYSLGETAGLFALRVWTERDEMLRRVMNSSLFAIDLAGECRAARAAWKLSREERADWLAGVVNSPAGDVRQLLQESANLQRVYLLISNTPQEAVIGGERRQVDAAVRRLGGSFHPLRGVSTVHCEIVRQVEQAYRELHLLRTTAPNGVRFYSAAWGRAYGVSEQAAANSILAQALHGFDFPALIHQAYADGVRAFIEIGPGATCTRMLEQILGTRPYLAHSAHVGNQNALLTVLQLLGSLIAHRIPVDLNALYGHPTEVVGHRDSNGQSGAPHLKVIVGADEIRLPALPARRAAPRLQEPPQQPFIMEAHSSSESTGAKEGIASALLRQLSATQSAKAAAHAAQLRFMQRLQQVYSEQLSFQTTILQNAVTTANCERLELEAWPVVQTPVAYAPGSPLGREMCVEFAVGSIAKVLGPEFAEVDTYPTRVRLPDEPLMLVDRILSVTGEPRSLASGRVVTEHDIQPDSWYLDCGRIPTCIAVEAGQADLFLSGYLGIDFQTRGLAVYRLLDACVTFHRGLPGPGEVIRYDIRIERFFRQGDTYLFRFSFEGTVNGDPLLTMRDGCAGFFTAAELDAGKGIVQTELDRRPQPRALPADWEAFVHMAVESYDEQQVDALRAGRLDECFGHAFTGLGLANPLRLPGGRMKLVDRVLHLDPRGGRYGLGQIRAEADIHPDDWFLTCHFVDDRVMPGTLMYECCLHTLRIFLLRMGWVAELDEVACEPVPGISSKLKCRGQVVESTRTVTYEVSVKEIGYRPEPYAIVDALMYADGKPIVEIGDMSLQMTGLTREKIRAIWQQAKRASVDASARRAERPAPTSRLRLDARADRKKPLFDRDRIRAFAIGKPSEAFGEPYRVFDSERVIARLPGPPYSFLDRITAIQAEPWKLVAGGVIEAEYDVPPDAWYFAANRQARLPFAVLLEVALQPCGWLAAYLGSALTSAVDLSFRNLGGEAVQFQAVTPNSGTLTTKVKITKVANSLGMLIQDFDFEVRAGSDKVYAGDTYFGFFTRQALADQVGIRDARVIPVESGAGSGERDYPDAAPFPDRQLRMIDRIDALLPRGGPGGLGFIAGTKRVDAEDWYFRAHFYQDPVCPGSLGLESLLQLLKVFAVERWGAGQFAEFQPGQPHRWTYRGQVLPTHQTVAVQAIVTAIDDERRWLQADGWLSVDGRVIYQMNDFSLGMVVDHG